MEGDIRNKMNEKMKYCVDEIRKYSAGVHELKKGIRKEKIKLFEKKQVLFYLMTIWNF